MNIDVNVVLRAMGEDVKYPYRQQDEIWLFSCMSEAERFIAKLYTQEMKKVVDMSLEGKAIPFNRAKTCEETYSIYDDIRSTLLGNIEKEAKDIYDKATSIDNEDEWGTSPLRDFIFDSAFELSTYISLVLKHCINIGVKFEEYFANSETFDMEFVLNRLSSSEEEYRFTTIWIEELEEWLYYGNIIPLGHQEVLDRLEAGYVEYTYVVDKYGMIRSNTYDRDAINIPFEKEVMSFKSWVELTKEANRVICTIEEELL